MVIPLQCDPGTEQVLTAPDADAPGAFTWRGGATSAQYYVNNAGVSVKDGCVWGQASGVVGNWAPYVRLAHSAEQWVASANVVTDFRCWKEG